MFSNAGEKKSNDARNTSGGLLPRAGKTWDKNLVCGESLIPLTPARFLHSEFRVASRAASKRRP